MNPATATHGTAKRVRQTKQAPPEGDFVIKTVVMDVVECGDCGERFAISHGHDVCDPVAAGRQAVWLKDRLVWDHIQESKHRGSISLPDLSGNK